MSRYISANAHVDLEPSPSAPVVRHKCPPVGDIEAMQKQLKTLGDAAVAVMLALRSEPGLTPRVAAEFAAVCDQTAGMALRVAEIPKPPEPVDEEMRDATQASAGWGGG